MTDDSRHDVTASPQPGDAFDQRGRFIAGMRYFARDQKGAGAIIFAFALPIMVMSIGLLAMSSPWGACCTSCSRVVLCRSP